MPEHTASETPLNLNNSHLAKHFTTIQSEFRLHLYKYITALLLTPLFAHTQTIIWSEDFETGYVNGDIVAQDNNVRSGADWTLSGSGTFEAVSTTNPIAGSFSFRTRGGGYTFTTEIIDITGVANVSISMELNEINAGTGDRIETFYSLDGGTNIEFGDGNGDGDFNNVSNSVSSLNGNTLVITITTTTNASTDRYKWDNIIVQANSVLPVTLVDFSAEHRDNKGILAWQTASEINNDFFEIYRASDADDWIKIGEVDGAGDSQDLLSYEFIDANPPSGAVYYKLRQVDYDLEHSYSHIETVTIPKNPNALALRLYPNPCREVMKVEQPGNSSIRVFSMTGTEVTQFVHPQSITERQLELNTTQLSPGSYILMAGDERRVFYKY